MLLAAGSRLDAYEIIAPLGAGGMGEVYRARDTLLKRDVAIKVLPDYWSRDTDRLQRFELEAQATAALNHPNIVSIFHVGQYNGSPYIVTELLQGESLRDRLRRGPMRLRETCDLGVNIARGLASAHDAGIVHRDLKPENLFVTKDGRLKILDFGLAKLLQPQTVSEDAPTATIQQQTDPGHVVGTVGYMAPEQVRGGAADARTDIFAFGVILYEMLTGRRAFQKDTSAETMSAILNEEPPPVSQTGQGFPPPLQRIVSRCLEKKPEQRFQHASDLGFALETLSDSGSTAIAAVGQPVSGKRRIWIAAAAIAIAICGFMLWWRLPPANPVVEAVTQLTDDGEIKANSGRLVTDGSRIYFGEGTLGSYRIMQVAATGGPTAIIPTRLPNFQFTALSQDGSYLLGAAGDSFVLPFWAVPLPAGEPRRLGSIEAQDADLFPDGRILFSLGKDLYIAEKDGSQPRKLLSASGLIREPSVSADGERLVFTIYSHGRATTSNGPISIDEARADGSGLRPILNTSDAGQVCCARWTPDGRYIVYQNRYEGRRNLWVLPMKAGPLQRSRQPVQLTNGPLAYRSAVASRDGKQIFAVGMKMRGELVRYDVNSKQFLPLLPGVAAFDPTFSRDGEWVAYTVYPDHTLWRSRSDGTEPLQLTFPPAQVFFPSISPDGKQVAYTTSAGAVRLISMDGGSPQTIAEGDFYGPNWSPDGNLLVFADFSGIHLFDPGTGKRSVVPGPEGLNFPRWVAEDMLVAATKDHKKLVVFDVKTQRWSDLVSSTTTGYVVNWAHSPDYKYVYYTTGGAEPMASRIRLADHQVETITSLKGLPRGTGPGGNTEISVAPDGSAVFTRNTGTQEIYALTVKWP
jgi:eukaryotic-like serine/threonine-protein kinase